MPEMIKKLLIFLVISGLCLSAFFIRLENFKKPTPRTTDEIVYYIMARQMAVNFFDYNATNYALYEMVAHQKKYPPYFKDPLFKHPPLFTLMVLGSVKMYGPTALGAGFVPLLFGALAISLVYFMGKLAAGRVVGVLSAGLMWIDPAAIMSSQKVWMDAPLMFFMLLTVYGYWRAVRKKEDSFFLIGGLAAGTACMIKYPGILTLFAVVIFFLLMEPRVFKNRYFQWSLTLPLVMAVPWIWWNYLIYGGDFIFRQIKAHEFGSIFSPIILFPAGVFTAGGFLCWCMTRNADALQQKTKALIQSKGIRYVKYAGFAGAIIFALRQANVSLDFFTLPYVSWQQNIFAGEPGWFYLQRLLEYSFVYLFAYLAFFDPFFKGSKDLLLIKMNVFFILIFFVALRNFQCRYILPALPFLMILASDYIVKLFKKAAAVEYVYLRMFLQAALLVLIVFALSKTFVINQEISFTNDMCYF